MSARATAIRGALVAVAVVVGLAACGSDDTPSVDGSLAGPAGQASGPLSFTGELLGGGQVDGTSLAGQAVMLWFWAPT